ADAIALWQNDQPFRAFFVLLLAVGRQAKARRAAAHSTRPVSAPSRPPAIRCRFQAMAPSTPPPISPGEPISRTKNSASNQVISREMSDIDQSTAAAMAWLAAPGLVVVSPRGSSSGAP